MEAVSASAAVQPCSGKSSGLGVDFGGVWVLSRGLYSIEAAFCLSGLQQSLGEKWVPSLQAGS